MEGYWLAHWFKPLLTLLISHYEVTALCVGSNSDPLFCGLLVVLTITVVNLIVFKKISNDFRRAPCSEEQEIRVRVGSLVEY